MTADDLVDLTIETLGAQGDGIARRDGHRIMVPLSLPGERVRARLGRPRDGVVMAQRVVRLSDAAERVTPVCRHFGSCGGCALQHLAAGPYLEFKRSQVEQALSRAGLPNVAVASPIVVPPASRRRAVLAGSYPRRGPVRLGFMARASHDVVDVAECAVLDPQLLAAITPLRRALGRLWAPDTTGDVSVTLTDAGLDVVVDLARRPDLATLEVLAELADDLDLARLCWRLDGAPAELAVERRTPHVVMAGVSVILPPGGFLQASVAAERAMIDLVRAATAGAGRIADLYAGCGTFSLALGANASVHAVEGDAAALAALAAAARRAGLVRLSTETRDLARRPLSSLELRGFEAVVFDPPRAGARAQAVELAASAVPVVVAVSCNPATFGRDAALLVAGGYRLQMVQPVDQFLWSGHVEMVAVFQRQ
jgi:23S rRNA (uracil1939-C5)-methyltransferase